MQFGITCFVKPWDTPKFPPGSVSNVAVGKALLGTILHPAAKSISMVVTPDNLEKLTTTGIVDTVNPYSVFEGDLNFNEY